MKSSTVSVVMPNLNGEKLLEKNLPKLIAAKNYKPNNISEIIVVDDGSWDKSVSFLQKNYPEIRLFKHKLNRGFSAAVNTGVRAAKGNLILLLNTDVLPNKDFLEKVLEDFDDKSVFAVSLHEKGYGPAKVYFADGYIQLAMGEEKPEIQKTFYVSGGSGVFRRTTWMELGGMDEKLFSPFYWEDIDLCYRATKRGYKLLWDPRGIVEHHHESTISKFPKSYVGRVKERNRLLMLWKDLTSLNLIRKHIVGITLRTIKHPGYIRVILMALMRLNVALTKRRKETKESKISDETILSRFHD